MTIESLPVLALRDVVLFPGMVAPLFIGRESSISATHKARDIGSKEHILLTTQKKPDIDDPKSSDLHNIGVIGRIIQTVKLPNNTLKLLIDIEQRVSLEFISNPAFPMAKYKLLPDDPIDNLQVIDSIIGEIITKFSEYVKINRKINPDILATISGQKNPTYLTNIIASHLTCKLDRKQELLEFTNICKRAENLLTLIETEIALIETEQDVQIQVKKQIEKSQRDYFLNEQMKIIQKELTGHDDKTEIQEFEQKIKTLKLSKEAKEKAESELRKLKAMNPMAAESSVLRNYLDTLLSMPWGKEDKANIDIKKAKEILDRDHYGLHKVKERIIEYLAVLQRSKSLKSPIICFVGPPGVGKTSLVKSIAEAVGRKYIKFALGGVRDEAEIRGHRRTYLGSMPGKIISSIKKIKTNNPVLLLDEIDKMSSDFRGDPASAMLEVLDPEQNKYFSDHYLDVEYDLSKVMFIATANSYNLPRPLLDRLEIINISGYVEDEKLQIAKNYLIPKQLKAHGVKKSELTIEDDAVLEMIRYYTRESGVRNLEREIGALARKVLTILLSDQKIKSLNVKAHDLETYLGVKKYKFGIVEQNDQIGVCAGLSYSEVGGDLLTIEAVTIPGKGEIKTTGKLGDVMKESAQAAFSAVQSRLDELGVTHESYKNLDIHLHVPEGAIPKDGPSAGITIFTTLVSLLTKIPVKKTIAMTGEITLRGNVLPIGGLKEKLLGASRGGIKTVIIPSENEKDLKEIPDNIKQSLKIIPIAKVDELYTIAFTKDPRKTHKLKA